MEIEANVYICRNIMEMFNAMFLEPTVDKEQGQGELEKQPLLVSYWTTT